MLTALKIILFTLYHVSSARVPYVEPEFLEMLRSTGQHELFAKYLGLDDVSLVLPVEGRTEEDMMFTTVSPLGDILLTPEQEEQTRQGVDLIKFPTYRWPNDELPYAIDTSRSGFGWWDRYRIENAIRTLNNSLTNVKIVQRQPHHQDYVMVINGQGCYSYMGRVGGQQVLSLQSNGCLRDGTIQHEFIHALGVMHEQCRPDRDDYVEVLFENIEPDWRAQYQKADARMFTVMTKYDAYSVMHYPMRTSNGKDAFKFKDQAIDTSKVGQRTGPSKSDIYKVDKMYA